MPQYRPQSARYADGGWTGKDLNRVNILPPSQDELRTQYPALYGALAGLMTTAPDQMAGSVLEPGYADRKAGALPALPALALDQEDALKQYSGYAKGGRVTVCNTGGKSTAIHINQPFVRIKGFDDKGA